MENRLKIWISVLIFSICGVSSIFAEYRIGAGDVIEIRFWQDADLNTQVRVNQDGMITLDIVGAIQAAGRTTDELQNDIVRQMSRLDARISQAIVRIFEYQYQHVFVKGQVATPGKYAFEEIPDLWTLINESGGITEYGDLSRVTIIRGGDKAGQIEIVDVARAIAQGKLNSLPKISRQDTIEIPRNPVGVPSSDISQQVQQKNVIYVIGAVNTPGPIQYEDNIDIIEALSLAGGPADNANMKKATIIKKDGLYGQTMEINLDQYVENGTPARYIIGKEETVLLPANRDGFLRRNVGTIATVLGIATSALIIYNTLDNNSNNTAVGGN